MKITFYGAAQNVTGSKHLIETKNFKLLLDCGLHQGKKALVREMNSHLPFEAAQVDAVILSHAHTDHAGMLPVLVKNGFKGKIYATTATTDVCRYLLMDSAKIQEQDAFEHNRIHPLDEAIQPLYNAFDVEAAMRHFEPTPYFRLTHHWTQITDNIRFKFYDAGHILGSAITLLEVTEDGQTKTLAFSGDLGNDYVPLLHSPEHIKESVDAMILECTYGGSNHGELEDATDRLQRLIMEAVRHQSKVIIPSFSLGRTQELIYILHQLSDRKLIPNIPIYIDSPLAANLADVFAAHREDYSEQTWKDFGGRDSVPLLFKNLHYTHSPEESKKLNDTPGPLIIISASGMAEGGRVLHHLKHNLSNPHSTIILSGYQAENTLGRKIQEGISPVKVLGEWLDVNARVISFDEFSAHADQNGLTSYIEHTKGLTQLFLVHTELPQATTFKHHAEEQFPNLKVTIPEVGTSFEV
jgi:metallo-beta-lactamase family protein